MMASGFISRMLPTRSDAPSVYDTIRQHEDDDTETDTSDDGRTRALTLDERNLDENSLNLDIEAAKLYLEESHATNQSAGPSIRRNVDGFRSKLGNGLSKLGATSRGRKPSRLLDVEEANDEVPASLLIEGGELGGEGHHADLRSNIGASNRAPPPLRSPDRPACNQWEAVRANQRLHSADATRLTEGVNIPGKPLPGLGLGLAHPRDKAMWRWANVENVDNYIKEVYMYYLGNGIWSILLSRCLNLLTLAFVVGFSTFLLYCVEFRRVPGSQRLSDVLVPQCTRKMSSFSNFLLWMFCFVWFAKLSQWVLDIQRLLQMRAFYQHLLGVSDADIQTISWQEIVGRLMDLRDFNPTTAARVSASHRRFLGSQSKERMDAHDIANRLMRKENYLIALFNKEVLDLTLPIPLLQNRQLFSRNLEWNINLCVIDFVFNNQGQVRKAFLKDSNRQMLSQGLRRRFLIAGSINIFVAPFMVAYFLMLYFFRNFTEYQKNPARIGSRQYSPLAQWKFREFNELWHLFERRINMSHPFASRYVDQFPKDKTIQVCRFVAFVFGALAAILALGALLDPEMFLSFELTPNRTVLFYLTVFGAIWAATRNMIPDDNVVFDPEQALNEVTAFTRYNPVHWQGRYHSDEIRKEFTQLYQMEVVIFLEEILSMVFTPFILWFSLPKCSERLIDFFREFTVHVDGLGYVCSFAVFDFKKNANLVRSKTDQVAEEQARTTSIRQEYFATKDNKLEASYWGFINDYAQNPKTGIPFYSPQSTRHRYRPPPPFPGPMSASLVAGVNHGMTIAGKQEWLGRSRAATSALAGGASQNMRLPGLDQAVNEEPPTSILLDRHHQPLAHGFRASASKSTRSRNRPSRQQSATTRRADEDEDDEVHEGAISLGDSWEVQRAGAPGEGQVDEDGIDLEKSVAPETGNKPSVLGIIKQFQMDRTHGRANAGIL